MFGGVRKVDSADKVPYVNKKGLENPAKSIQIFTMLSNVLSKCLTIKAEKN